MLQTYLGIPLPLRDGVWFTARNKLLNLPQPSRCSAYVTASVRFGQIKNGSYFFTRNHAVLLKKGDRPLQYSEEKTASKRSANA
jgi:hypothetical protein